MKRIALVLFFSTLATTLAAAQEVPEGRTAIPSPLPIASKCSVAVTDIEGVPDSFGGGIDPTTLSPALTAFLTANPPKSQYDEPGCNKHFGESFRVCTCETCGAKLEIQVRRCGSSLDNNDGYTVGIAPFTPGLRVAQGLVWATGDPPTKTLTIALPADQLNKVLCGNKSQWLDVYIQDDTIIDSMKLTIYHP